MDAGFLLALGYTITPPKKLEKVIVNCSFNHGKAFYYPVDEITKKAVSTIGRKVLTENDLKALRVLGHEVALINRANGEKAEKIFSAMKERIANYGDA